MHVRLLTSILMIGAAIAVASVPAAPSLAQQKKDHGHADHKHNHPTVQHGGILEDVGEYHVEFVAKDGKITLYIRNHEAKDAATEGFKASVLLTAGQQRIGPIEIKPAGANKMEGPAATVPPGATAILTLTDKGGTAAQGRFKLK
ncbi:MAG: hypothetical protein AB7O71_19310 [Hyphomicrobiaceae bacterium]|jgi:hypothetical protein